MNAECEVVMLALAELEKQSREKDERISRLEHRVRELEGRADAHGMFIERHARCVTRQERQ